MRLVLQESVALIERSPSYAIARLQRRRKLPTVVAGRGWHDHSLIQTGMSLCASCALQLTGDAALCPHHHCVYGDDWAVANRIMCDFFHRKKIPPRLAPLERDDDFWAHAAEAA